MKKKRIGRPFKPAKPRTRVSLGLKVTAEMKDRIEAAAKRSGRTQSQEAEAWLERALQYDAMLATLRKQLAEFETMAVEGIFLSRGYRIGQHSQWGPVWVPKDYPGERSGFVSDEEAAKFMGKKDAR